MNDAIDRLEAIELDECAAHWTTGFDRLTDLYAHSDDGYVRQSVVRAIEAIAHGLASAMKALESTGAEIDEAALRHRLDTTGGSLLEALQDEDGRVRQSAIRALKACFRAYEALDDGETIGEELAELADEYTGSRREQVVKAKGDAAFFSWPGDDRLIEGLRTLMQGADGTD